MPFSFFILDVADIMSHFGISNVADNSSEFVLIIGVFLHQIWVVLLFSFIVIQSVRVNIEAGGELVFVCQFLVDESLEVEVDSLEMNDEIVRHFADPCLL